MGKAMKAKSVSPVKAMKAMKAMKAKSLSPVKAMKTMKAMKAMKAKSVSPVKAMKAMKAMKAKSVSPMKAMKAKSVAMKARKAGASMTASGAYQSVATTTGLKTKDVKGVVESIMDVAAEQLNKTGSFKLAGMLSMKLKKKAARPAKKG